MPTIIRTQAEIAAASNQVLIDTYNAFTGKSIKKFSSRAAGEAQVANAILKGQNDAAHAGVPKGTEPAAATVAELEASTAADAAAKPPTEEKETEVTATAKETRDAVRAKRYPSEAKKPAPAAKKAKAKAKAKPAPAAKKAKAAPASGKHATYAYIKLTKPDTLRRPQPGSKRTEVLTAIQNAFADKSVKRLAIEDLSKRLKFDVRSYVHKLAAVGWVEVVGA